LEWELKLESSVEKTGIKVIEKCEVSFGINPVISILLSLSIDNKIERIKPEIMSENNHPQRLAMHE
jgi:hypothetical protein